MSDTSTTEPNPAAEVESAPSQTPPSAAPTVAPVHQSAAQSPAQPQSSSPAPGQSPSSGAVGGGNYEVQQGDCIESIAIDRGFFWETIWKDPNNSDLKNARKNPNVLREGDKVFLPDLRPKQESGATEKRHKFKRKGVPSKISFVLKDEKGKPRANEPYVLEIDGELISGSTGSQGELEQPIPPNAQKGRLIIGNDGLETYPLNLGHIDPITEVSGIQARLSNLGYYHGTIDGQMNAQTQEAVSSFQGKHGLQKTGQVDAATRDRLTTEHGC